MIYYWDVFQCQLVWVYALSGFCMGTTEDPSLRFFATMHVKDQVLGNVFRGTFSDSFQQNLSPPPHHRLPIVRTSCSQLLVRSEIFCLIVEVVYSSCGLKFVYPTINLNFLQIIVKIKHLVKFCLHSLGWFCLQISNDAKYFSPLVQAILIED